MSEQPAPLSLRERVLYSLGKTPIETSIRILGLGEDVSTGTDISGISARDDLLEKQEEKPPITVPIDFSKKPDYLNSPDEIRAKPGFDIKKLEIPTFRHRIFRKLTKGFGDPPPTFVRQESEHVPTKSLSKSDKYFITMNEMDPINTESDAARHILDLFRGNYILETNQWKWRDQNERHPDHPGVNLSLLPHSGWFSGERVLGEFIGRDYGSMYSTMHHIARESAKRGLDFKDIIRKFNILLDEILLETFFKGI